MYSLSQLEKTTTKSGKRIGRGHGSGRGGHTSTRGHKGQKARQNIGLFFEGTKFKKSLLKKLPLYRGKGKFKSKSSPAFVVNLKYLSLFKEGEKVDLISLQEKGVLEKKLPVGTKVKILGEGEVKFGLKIYLPCSKQAADKIKKAGGEILVNKEEKIEKVEEVKKETEEKIKIKKVSKKKITKKSKEK